MKPPSKQNKTASDVLHTERKVGKTTNKMSTQLRTAMEAKSGEERILWSSLDGLYQETGSGVLQFAQMVMDIFNQVESAGLADEALHEIARTGASDAELYAKDLSAVKEKYKNKKGLVKVEELTEYYDHTEEFHSIFDRFRTTSLHIATELSKYGLSMEQHLLNEQKKKESENETTVDVGVEETKPNVVESSTFGDSTDGTE